MTLITLDEDEVGVRSGLFISRYSWTEAETERSSKGVVNKTRFTRKSCCRGRRADRKAALGCRI